MLPFVQDIIASHHYRFEEFRAHRKAMQPRTTSRNLHGNLVHHVSFSEVTTGK